MNSSDPKTNPADLNDTMIDVALYPERFDELEDSWERFLDLTFDGITESPIEERVGQNVHRALDLLERLEGLTRAQLDAQKLVASNPGIGLVFDSSREILARNEAFDAAFGAYGSQFEHPDFGPEIGRKTGGGQVRQSNADTPFNFVSAMTDCGQQKTFLIVPVSLRVDSASDVFFLTELDIRLDDEVIAAFVSAFGLTSAEAQVCLLLANGHSPQEIADLRDVSLNTVRAQLRISIEKCGARGSTDLVRRLCGMAARLSHLSLRSVGKGEGPLASDISQNSIILSDGRAMHYFDQGARDGLPVIMLHTALESPLLFGHFRDMAKALGVRIIAPSRPGFGMSDLPPRTELDRSLDVFADDLLQLLDSLEIDRCQLIGQHHAVRFASLNPERVSRIVHHNGLPIWSDDMLSAMTTRRRNLIKTSLRWPGSVRLLVKVAMALIRSGKEELFLRGLAIGSETNIAALRSAEFLNHARWECRHAAEQGSDQFLHEVPLFHTDFSDELRDLPCQLDAVLYLGPSHVPQAAIDTFQRLRPDARVERTENQEALWDRLFRSLAGSVGTNTPN